MSLLFHSRWRVQFVAVQRSPIVQFVHHIPSTCIPKIMLFGRCNLCNAMAWLLSYYHDFIYICLDAIPQKNTTQFRVGSLIHLINFNAMHWLNHWTEIQHKTNNIISIFILNSSILRLTRGYISFQNIIYNWWLVFSFAS